MEWANIRQETIKSGKYKDIGSPFREMSDEERKKLQDFTNEVFEQFVAEVEERRKMSHEEVLALANGMIYSGRRAIDLGLVDKEGTLMDAIAMAAVEADIEGEPQVVYPSPPTFWRQLISGKIRVFNGIIPWQGMRAMYLFRP